MSILATAAVFACIWTHGTDLRGQKVSLNTTGGQEIVQDLQQFEPRSYWERAKAKRATNLATPEARNDYAAMMLHLGEIAPAIAILEELERDKPNQYATAANLGTAYELAGRNAEALEWIRKSIARNENAHDGTEWLHVRILEAKLALARDPSWLQHHSVLGIDFGNGPIPKKAETLPKGNTSRPLTLEDVKQALDYQLDERYQFVKAPDPIVGSLLYEWASILHRSETLESAAALYREAIRFGAPRTDLARFRLTRIEQFLRDQEVRKK
jgi:tetratricopeptide (TPR) repeat protein